MAVQRADDWHDAFTIVERYSVVALAFSVDVGLVQGANWVTESVFLDEARFAETSIAVAVIVVSW